MYAISVILDVDPAHVDEFKATALAHAQNSKSNEQGCLEFSVFQSAERPDRFYFHEVYIDKAAVTEVHHKAPYMAEFSKKTEPWVRSKTHGFWESLENR